MAYNTAKMITDADGKLIPQMYDPATDTYKPLTPDAYNNINVNSGTLSVDNFPSKQDVQLTGSTVAQDETGTPVKQPVDLQNHNLTDLDALPIRPAPQNEVIIEHSINYNEWNLNSTNNTSIYVGTTVNTASSQINAIDTSKYKDIVILFDNNLDVPLRFSAVRLTTRAGGLSGIKTLFDIVDSSVSIPAGDSNTLESNTFPKLSLPHLGLWMALNTGSAYAGATSGTFDITVVGVV